MESDRRRNGSFSFVVLFNLPSCSSRVFSGASVILLGDNNVMPGAHVSRFHSVCCIGFPQLITHSVSQTLNPSHPPMEVLAATRPNPKRQGSPLGITSTGTHLFLAPNPSPRSFKPSNPPFFETMVTPTIDEPHDREGLRNVSNLSCYIWFRSSSLPHEEGSCFVTKSQSTAQSQ